MKEQAIKPMPVPGPELRFAKRMYAEQIGDVTVTNTYLKIVVLVLALIAGGLIFVNIRTIKMVQNFKPLIVRINDIGRAEAINYDALGYKPQDAEVKYFLSQFTQLYYGRNRYTLRDNLNESLLFMENSLGNNVQQAFQKNKTYDLDPNQPVIDVDVKKVSIEDLRSAPYKATVDFEKVYYSPIDRAEQKRVLFTAHYVFLFRDTVPNDLVKVNPLGLAITYFREDEAF